MFWHIDQSDIYNTKYAHFHTKYDPRHAFILLTPTRDFYGLALVLPCNPPFDIYREKFRFLIQISRSLP